MSVFSVEEVLEENLQHGTLLFNRRSINTTLLEVESHLRLGGGLQYLENIKNIHHTRK